MATLLKHGRYRMMIKKTRHVLFCNSTAMVLVLLMLPLYVCPAAAGELSEVPAAQPRGFSLPDLAGQSHSLSEFGGKVILVNFWASWCRPCIAEMPSIQRLMQLMKGTPFAVFGINVGEGERRVRATVQRLGIEFPVVLDKDSAVFKGWGGNVLPTTCVLDSLGRARYVGLGPVEWDSAEIVALLKKLATESPTEAPRPTGQ
jgi:thiol-disulfide isomerase/thioredoxin